MRLMQNNDKPQLPVFEQAVAPDGQGSCTGDCGDRIDIALRARDGVITGATFGCNGCRYTWLCARTAASLAQGGTLAEGLKVNAVHVLDVLEDVPEGHEHCAIIAVNALHAAIADALRNQHEPWKKLYR